MLQNIMAANVKMAKELNEDTGFTISVKTLIAIGFAISTVVGMWFALQADIAEAKELPAPVIDRIEYDLKDELIRQTILDTQEDVEAMRDQLDKICLLYTSPSPRDRQKSRMPSSA